MRAQASAVEEGMGPRHRLAPGPRWHRIQLADGTVEGLKWIALVLMSLDHTNKYLLHERVAPLFALGRLAFPIFGFVLAYNLARPGVLHRGTYPRLLGRLLLFGAIAEIPFVALGGLAWGWYPLNILMTLLVSATIIWFINLGGAWRIAAAIALFMVGGALVEFWWPGVALCVCAWWHCRSPSAGSLAAWLAATVSLSLINANAWAVAALGLIFLAPCFSWQVPRIRWAFYGFYPAHLAVLWGLVQCGIAGR